jgi:hypothetical protein
VGGRDASAFQRAWWTGANILAWARVKRDATVI